MSFKELKDSTEGKQLNISASIRPNRVNIMFQNAYLEHKEVVGAQGVKIAAKELEKAIAGLNLLVAQKPDEVDIMK